MLAITETQFAAMTREHMIARMQRFLTAHTADPALQALLAAPGACRDFWLPWYDRYAERDEHALAVRLSYILAARAHGFEPQLLQNESGDAEAAMKSELEQRGILPFIAFDQG